MDTIESLSSRNRAKILIQKLRMYEDKIDSDRAIKLALVIARRSDLIPESHPEDNFFGLGSLAQAAFLLRQLISRIEDTTLRENTAKDVAMNIERLPFAYEFRRKVRKLKKEYGSEELVAVVSDQCEQEIGRIFAEKLARATESAPIEDTYPQWQRSFYIEWRWNNQEGLRQYVQHRLQEDAGDVSKFLNAVLGLSNDDMRPITNSDEEYRFLADIIHPDEMMSFIRSCYPEINNSNLPRSVRWFVAMYEREGYCNPAE